MGRLIQRHDIIKAEPMRFLIRAALGLFLLQSAVVTTLISAARDWLPVGEIIAFSSSGRASQDIFIQDVSRGLVRNVSVQMGSHHDSWPAWSPDGFHIVFTSTADSFAPTDLYVVGIDGSDLRQITHSTSGEFNPAWSPDGRQIALVSRQTGHHEIYVMDVNGDNPRQLTDNSEFDAGYVIMPVWSPDSTRIAYYSMRPEHAGIYVVAVDGGDERYLVANGNPSFAWSPDGSQIAFITADGAINLMEIESGSVERLDIPGTQTALRWLPDSNRLVYLSHRCVCDPAIYVMDMNSGDEHLFTGGMYGDTLPAWRPS